MSQVSHSNSRRKDRALSDTSARWLSDIMNPLVIPPLVFSVIGFAERLPYTRLVLLLVISIIFYSIIPFGAALVISHRHTNYSLDFLKRRSRIPLYKLSIFSVLIGSVLLSKLFQNYFIRIVVVVFLINLFCSFTINLKWKVSLHSTALSTGGLILLLFGLHTSTGLPLIISGTILLSLILPIIMWSRYQLKIHSKAELFGGTAVGVLLTLISFMLSQ